MSAHSTRKRARTESENTIKQEPEEEATTTTRADPQPDLGQHENQLERDAEFWFSDGTVILVARDVEFRIYRALLADYSPVFKAMFAGLHPSRRVPIDEHQSITCPVVQLTDSPEDLRHVLRAYVSRKEMRFFEEAKPSFHQISAYIRLGQKYELEELYDQSRQLLKRHYTDDLETWMNLPHWEPSNWRDNDSIGVVNLARLINEPTLLPTALMGSVYLDGNIVQGFEREDGTREMLALDDLGRCFRASKDIREANLTAIMRTFQEKVSPACNKEKSCKAVLRLALRRVEEKLDWLMTNGPFMSFDALVRNIPKELATCAECTTMVEERYRKECEAFWARLPELLDIEVPGWPAVVAEETA